MKAMGVEAALVRSTDRYLNEYVPTEESARAWLTGFTGSMGEALVTPERAFLAVDGRYWLQADKEVDLESWEVVKVRMGTGLDKALLDQLAALTAELGPKKKLDVGFEPDRLTPRALARFEDAVPKARFKPLFPSPVEAARGSERPAPAEPGIRTVDEARVGRAVREKLGDVAEVLEAAGAEALLVQRLDEIMWLANLRGSELPYQATFKTIALATPETLFLGVDPAKVPGAVRRAREPIMFVPEAELWSSVGKKAKRRRVAFDPDNNTVQAKLQLEKAGAQLVEVAAPLQPLRARKNPAELAVMKEAFREADLVVEGAIAWACDEVEAGERVTEASFAEEVTRRFHEAGAVGLSFRVISAAGKNGAHIHYGSPSKRRALEAGELVLLDTGAYFEEGYATDLTRTFLVGGKAQAATDEQRRIYTTVLKAAIAGMKAVVPVGAKGHQLDAIVRAPLWAEGLDYSHGTGHGVGINVHEFPPRIGPSSASTLEVGHVFSIEPGYYAPSFGGVRIENLCTLEPGPEGFMRVRPLTFSPLDKRLIDVKRLNADEKAFLRAFEKQRPRPGRGGAARAANRKPGPKKAARRPART
jgi:Xaa-Pro aminopeptidase